MPSKKQMRTKYELLQREPSQNNPHFTMPRVSKHESVDTKMG